MRRGVIVVALASALALLCSPHERARADIGEPLVGLIVNERYELMPDPYDMRTTDIVLMIGVALGGYIPYFFSWYVDGALAATSYSFYYTATTPGEHRVRMHVTDLSQQFASDSLVIRVHDPTPSRRTSWGRIKALYR